MRKTIDVNGITLSYMEKNEDANEIIFFIHGNSCSSRMWRKQFESDQFENYRLIAIDLPGHGLSSCSSNPLEDYSPIGTARILSEALKNIADGKPYMFVGFSYGSNLSVEISMCGLNPIAIVLLESCVLGEGYGLDKVFAQNTTPSIFLYNETNENVVSDYLHKAILCGSENDIQNSIEDYLKVSKDFKPALFKTAAEGKISDEIRYLQQINMPICVIFGTEDSIVNINYLDEAPFPIWRNQINKLQSAGHWANIDCAERFNKLILDYVSEMFKANHV